MNCWEFPVILLFCVHGILFTSGATPTDGAPGFQCPPTYRNVRRNGTEFCVPMTQEEVAQGQQKQTDLKEPCPNGEILVVTASGQRCAPPGTKRRSRVACPRGQVPVQLQGRVLCVAPDPSHLQFCPPAHLRVNIDGQLKCYPVIELQPQRKPPPSLKGKHTGKKNRLASKGRRTGSKRGAKKRQRPPKNRRKNIASGLEKASAPNLDCADGMVPALSAGRYVCVDPVYPSGVCPAGKVPMMTRGGVTCAYCPPGKRAVQTRGGVQCTAAPFTPTPPQPPRRTSEPCPEGLAPVQTAVGRVCQYVPPSVPQEEPACPPGTRQINLDGTVTCGPASPVTCGPGQVAIETNTGQKTCGFQSSSVENPGTACPRGLVKMGGKCVYQQKKPNICPDGQKPVKTAAGFSCNRGDVNGNSKCTAGAILTETRKGFFCRALDPSVQTVPTCGQGSVVAHVESGLECIEAREAALVCLGDEELSRTAKWFACRRPPGTTSLLAVLTCSRGRVVTLNEHGQTVCISLAEATASCGAGYRAVPTGQQRFLCRKPRLDVRCPAGFVLKLTTEVPTCVSISDSDCLELAEGDCLPAPLPELSPCDAGYQLQVRPEGPACFLHVAGTGPGDVETAVTEPCGDASDAVRSCDLDPSVLLAGCNPDCANGGTCVNDTCVCTVGVTGSACHQDIDECHAPAPPNCGYRCVNTFGSFHCACPQGYLLNSDGLTCGRARCVPDCLNGGECRNGQCLCPRGFSGGYCQIDVDECQARRGLCQHQCRNTYGGYQCVCPPGTRLNTDQ